MGEGATGRDGGGAVACVFLRIHGITHLETDLARSCEAAWDANIGRGMAVVNGTSEQTGPSPLPEAGVAKQEDKTRLI